ncbi:nucleotide pyrophosphohydrolase [Pararobbsia alpina]|uniref:nucleotide pyrophosphohydrolase n=1 Tax=Pararobbsia alpina TaxID=621374 RepID=UPI0039A5F7D8
MRREKEETGTCGELDELRKLVHSFVNERDWGKFHTPKNLATALSVEASELLEPFQWLETGAAGELGALKLTAVRHEMADVLIYLICLADKLEVDLIQAATEKIAINKAKYPVEKVRGSAQKYSDYKE